MATKKTEEPNKKGKDAKSIGIDVKMPIEKCNDPKCPFHGKLKVHGRVFVGTVLSAKTTKTAKISWERIRKIPKYERYEKRMTSIFAYNPLCINAKAGDIVKIMECRPLSKTKNFVVVEKIGKKEFVKAEESLIEKEASKEKKDKAEKEKPKSGKETKEKVQ